MRKVPVRISPEELRRYYDEEELKRRFPDEAELIRFLHDEEGLCPREIGAILGCCDETVRKKMKKQGIKGRSKAEAMILASGYAHERRDFDGDERERAYLIGFCKGDCHVEMWSENSQTIVVDCHSTISEQIELFKRLFKPHGHVHKWETDEEGKVRIKAHLNLSFAFLLGLSDEIPPFALADEESFFSFLGGYSDAEGHIGISDGKAIFRLRSYDKNILHQAYEKLLELGIKFPKPTIEAPKGHTKKGGTKYHQDFWCLKTTCKDPLLKFFERLGPYLRHPKKIQGIEEAIRNIEERNARWEKKREREKRCKELRGKRDELLRRFLDERELIRYLYDKELMSQPQIGRILGWGTTTVWRKMKKHGIKARTFSEAKRIMYGRTPE